MSYTDIVIRYAETDQMGVVHHCVYPVWFEVARTDMMDQAGYPYARIESEGIMLPVSHIDCDYISGAKYGETVTVHCFVEKLSIARLVLGYEVRRKGENEVICTGRSMHGWTDTQMNVINLKKKAPELYAFLEKME